MWYVSITLRPHFNTETLHSFLIQHKFKCFSCWYNPRVKCVTFHNALHPKAFSCQPSWHDHNHSINSVNITAADLRFARPNSDSLSLTADCRARAKPLHILESKITIWMSAKSVAWCFSENLRTTPSIIVAISDTFCLNTPIKNNIVYTYRWQSKLWTKYMHCILCT